MTEILARPAPDSCASTGKLFRRERTDLAADWVVASGLVAYPEAVAAMEERARAIAEGTAAELVWLLQHPPLYTAGTSARAADLVDPNRLPVFASGRGGQYTYHGPGQRVAYAMLDLSDRGRDVRCYVHALEDWVIRSLARFGVVGERRDARVGVWVRRPEKGPAAEDKIAAIGVRVRRWVAFHGISVNISPDLADYAGIVPCGISDQGVTSLADLGRQVTMQEFDRVLRQEFEALFGRTREAA